VILTAGNKCCLRWRRQNPSVTFRKKVYERSNDYLKTRRTTWSKEKGNSEPGISPVRSRFNGGYRERELSSGGDATGLKGLSQISNWRISGKSGHYWPRKLSNSRNCQEEADGGTRATGTTLALRGRTKDQTSNCSESLIEGSPHWIVQSTRLGPGIINACHSAAVMNAPFALALVDIDNFKQINDKHGIKSVTWFSQK